MRIEIRVESKPGEMSTHVRRTLAHIVRGIGLNVMTIHECGEISKTKSLDQEYTFLIATAKAPENIEERLRKAVETAPV